MVYYEDEVLKAVKKGHIPEEIFNNIRNAFKIDKREDVYK